MGRRTDTVETTRLALELLRRIPRARKVTASELRDRLAAAGIERELRTIHRELDTLSAHFDIERDDAIKPYGYRWRSGASGMAMPKLSEQETLLLRLAEEHLQTLLPSALMKSLAGFFAQARPNPGPPSSTSREREWRSKVRVVTTDHPFWPPGLRPGVFKQVSEALYGNRCLRVEYKNSVGVTERSEVMPLVLAQPHHRLYLVCRFRGYDNERSLALHRIRSAKALTRTFTPPRQLGPRRYDPRRYDDDGRFGFGAGDRIRLSFQIDKDAGAPLLESPLSKDQEVIEKKGWYRVKATVVESAVLDKWLLGFGTQVTNVRRIEARCRRNARSLNDLARDADEKDFFHSLIHTTLDFSQGDGDLPSWRSLCDVQGHRKPVICVSNTRGRFNMESFFFVSVDKNPKVLTPATVCMSPSDLNAHLTWIGKNATRLIKRWKEANGKA